MFDLRIELRKRKVTGSHSDPDGFAGGSGEMIMSASKADFDGFPPSTHMLSHAPEVQFPSENHHRHSWNSPSSDHCNDTGGGKPARDGSGAGAAAESRQGVHHGLQSLGLCFHLKTGGSNEGKFLCSKARSYYST